MHLSYSRTRIGTLISGSFSLTKIIALVLSLTLFCSCRDGKSGFVIGVSQCSRDEWRSTANYEMEQLAAYYGMSIKVRSASDDTEAQKQDIRSLVSEGIDLLVVSPNESEGLTPLITEVYQSGIPVILFDRTTANDQYTAYVGADNRQIGRMAAEYIASNVNSQANVLLVRGTVGSSADTQRLEGFVEELKNYPGINIVSHIYGNFIKSEAYESTKEFFSGKDAKDHGIDVIFALNDFMAKGVYEALVDAGFKDNIPAIIGVDALSQGMQSVADGSMTATFLYPTGATNIMEIARSILLGLDYEKTTILNTSVVDRSNVRILLSQMSQMMENSQKLEILNNRVSDVTTTSFRLKLIVYICGFLLLVVIGLLLYTFRSYEVMADLSAKLNDQNAHIKDQVEALELQKIDLVNLSKKLEETTQAKLAFFTNISHEFKTPLSLISGPIEELSAMEGMPKEAGLKLDILRRNKSKLSRLIGELLDFRSVETDNVTVNYSMGNLGEFIAEIIRMFDDVVISRGLTFEYEKSGSDFELPFDPVKIEKIFTNLLSNAFNHVNREGTIRVNLTVSEEGGKHYRISVFNSGSYIPEEQRDKVFRQFYTLDATQKGTGIGLALVSSLVNLMKGTIDLESIEDVGTTFTVDIPVDKNLISDFPFEHTGYRYSFARQKHETIGDEYDNSGVYDDAYTGDKPVALVIEDNIDMRLYIKDVLSSEYHVMLAKDGDVGVKKAQMYKPSIIISDIMMPGKDGYEVCRELKSNSLLTNVPIILLTACSTDEQRARGYECGADGYMQKPFSVNILKTRMKALLDKFARINESLASSFIPNTSLSGMSSESVQLMEKIKKYVDEHVSEPISMEDIISHLGVSKSKFYRDIKDVTEEYSPTDIISLAKLRKAIEMMAIGHKNISETAFACGFSSASYFSRTFHKYYNMSPSEYIRQNYPDAKS